MNYPAEQLNPIDLKLEAIEEWEEDHLNCIAQLSRYEAELMLQRRDKRNPRIHSKAEINKATDDIYVRRIQDILSESGPNNANGYAVLMSVRNQWISFKRGEL